MNILELGALPFAISGAAPAHTTAPAGSGLPRGNPAPARESTPPPAVDPEAGRKALDVAVSRIREVLNASSAAVEFSVDNSSGRVVVRVVDGATNELIRQIPSDEVLAIAQVLDRLQGLLLREQA